MHADPGTRFYAAVEQVTHRNSEDYVHRSSKLAARLYSALEGDTICTGTSAAAAMIDLAHVDIGTSKLKAGIDRWRALSQPAIRTLKSDLDRLIAGGHHVKVALSRR